MKMIRKTVIERLVSEKLTPAYKFLQKLVLCPKLFQAIQSHRILLTIIDPILREYCICSDFYLKFPWVCCKWINLEPRRFSISCSRLFRIKGSLLPQKYIVISSAKLQMFDFPTIRKMSLMKMLESNGQSYSRSRQINSFLPRLDQSKKWMLG